MNRSCPGRRPIATVPGFLAVLGLLLSMVPGSSPLQACDLLPHEWIIVRKDPALSGDVSYALADALSQVRRKFETERAGAGEASGTILFLGAFGAEAGKPLQGVPREALERAVDAVWPSSLARCGWQTGLSMTDHQAMSRAALTIPASYAAFIQVRDSSDERIGLVDGVFFLWACVRVVMKESARVFVKILDRQGQTIFLDEITVSPTVFADLVLTPLGCYLSRLEKHDSRPLAMFFESLTPGVHGLFFQDQFPPEGALPPMSGWQAPLPGASALPQPSVVFFGTGSAPASP